MHVLTFPARKVTPLTPIIELLFGSYLLLECEMFGIFCQTCLDYSYTPLRPQSGAVNNGSDPEADKQWVVSPIVKITNLAAGPRHHPVIPGSSGATYL